MKLTLCAVLCGVAASKFISDADKKRCHKPKGRRTNDDCKAFVVEKAATTGYGTLPDECMTVTWFDAADATGDAKTLGTTGKWGSCSNMTVDDTWRYMVSNSVPDYYFCPYCPLGKGVNYCVEDEECIFADMLCGDESSVGTSQGFTAYGDVWVPYASYWKVPKVGDPTRDDRPAQMYATLTGVEKAIGASVAFTVQNGVSILGPNDAGDYNIDEAGFILPCGGHVTPPVDALEQGPPDVGAVPSDPPMYHYHKATECLDAFVNHDKRYSNGGGQSTHGELVAYANDGFGLYAYGDVGGAAPVLDECGGHFGPSDDAALGNVSYHYHATTYTPYHLACQGPALGGCDATQHGSNYCGAGCGAEVCAQPGVTTMDALAAYLDGFNSSWLSQYTTNLD